MKDFFKGVSRHIGKLDAEHLREQYARLSEEAVSLDTLFQTIAQGILVLDASGQLPRSFVVCTHPYHPQIVRLSPLSASGEVLGMASRLVTPPAAAARHPV